MKDPLVSITITTKNEGKNIKNCLDSIILQSYKNTEIIVVDNFSTDNTKKIARKYTNKVYNIGPERSTQRNYGMLKIAKGQYMLLVDADMIFSPNLVECCVKKIGNSQLVALHIPEIVLGKNYYSRVRRFERSFYDGTVIDGARFFRKDAFVKVGGFDENLCGPEDWDIDKKLKKIGRIALISTTSTSEVEVVSKLENKQWDLEKLILEKGVDPKKYGAVVYHNEAEFNLKKYLGKKGYYTQTIEKYAKKWNNDKDIRKQLGFGYRYFGVFWEHGKWKKLFIHPFLTFGMYYLRFLVGIKYIFRKK